MWIGWRKVKAMHLNCKGWHPKSSVLNDHEGVLLGAQHILYLDNRMRPNHLDWTPHACHKHEILGKPNFAITFKNILCHRFVWSLWVQGVLAWWDLVKSDEMDHQHWRMHVELRQCMVSPIHIWQVRGRCNVHRTHYKAACHDAAHPTH